MILCIPFIQLFLRKCVILETFAYLSGHHRALIQEPLGMPYLDTSQFIT